MVKTIQALICRELLPTPAPFDCPDTQMPEALMLGSGWMYTRRKPEVFRLIYNTLISVASVPQTSEYQAILVEKVLAAAQGVSKPRLVETNSTSENVTAQPAACSQECNITSCACIAVLALLVLRRFAVQIMQ